MYVRSMTIDDYEEVIAVWIAAGLIIDPVLDSKESIATVLDANPTGCFVASGHNGIIGAVLGTYNGRVGWLYHLGVLPEHQHNGIGSLLLKKAETALAEVGAKKIVLSVRSETQDIVPFYTERGYQGWTSLVFEKKSHLISSCIAERSLEAFPAQWKI